VPPGPVAVVIRPVTVIEGIITEKARASAVATVAKATAMAAEAASVAVAATTMSAASAASAAGEGFGLERGCAHRQAGNDNHRFLQHDILL
jgi:hypothetical protein